MRRLRILKRFGGQTSLIGAMISSIAVSVVEEQRSEKRLRAEHSLSMMSMRKISYLLQ